MKGFRDSHHSPARNYRRVFRLAVARAELSDLDPHGPHDLRHTSPPGWRMAASRLG
jgi:hypothetical protein